MNRHRAAIVLAAVALAGPPLLAVNDARADQPGLSPLAGAGDQPLPPWHVAGLPNQAKPVTRYTVVTLGGERVLRIEADSSYGNLVHPLPDVGGLHRLAWRWRIDQPNPLIDLRQKSGDDSAAKVCALFDMPLGAVPFVERQLLRIARNASAEPLPAASVCYVWDPKLAAGTALDNAFSRRVRYIVLRGPDSPQASWQREQRDLAADFKRLFGEESAVVPPLQGIAVSADADNTHGHSVAHVADLTLE